MLVSGYNESIEAQMLVLFKSLSERDRRRYAAIEALKIGYGGITYISKLFSCDEKTIRKGLKELQDEDSMEQESIRAPGGGRPSKLDLYENINEEFISILRDHTAGSPTDCDLKWTNLSKKEIQDKLKNKGIDVSRNIIKKLLHQNGFVRRKLQKKRVRVKAKIGIGSLEKSRN